MPNNPDNKKPHESYRYYAMTLDPVHVGTGGSRLGRVDNAIVREPGTNLPKIPGTSISGVCRAYAAMAIQSADPKKQKYRKDDGMSCVGKGADDGNGHCGQQDCEVCVTFGFSRKSGSSFQGLAQFFDARILFFPVYSMIGPVWVTCPAALADVGITSELSVDKEKFRKIGTAKHGGSLNFGWLMLVEDDTSHINVDLCGLFPVLFNNEKSLHAIKDKVYLVPNSLFTRIVNDNLEVRTSVAIDPATGAAEDGALYTYEAIPRATVMWFDVVYNRPEYFRIKKVDKVDKVDKEEPITVTQDNIKKTVTDGLSLMEALGIGGMNTRGMGRLKVYAGVKL